MNKRRFLYNAQVECAAGFQTFFVDAETRKQADKLIETEGDIYASEIEVQSLSDYEFDSETTTDDFGDFPPSPPAASPVPDSVRKIALSFLSYRQRVTLEDLTAKSRWTPRGCTNNTMCSLERSGLVEWKSDLWQLTEGGRLLFPAPSPKAEGE
ncbi:hypothetical protein FCN80_10230 [Martelella alba]|uniref:MarR family transcriptional regulator n=2 Tax=Martelella alba TaxID=2590451 RepID=A0ABY2SM80_9HYPH|nr:hypothetical protein FCN80_10230 [Martelella alba]